MAKGLGTGVGVGGGATSILGAGRGEGVGAGEASPSRVECVVVLMEMVIVVEMEGAEDAIPWSALVFATVAGAEAGGWEPVTGADETGTTGGDVPTVVGRRWKSGSGVGYIRCGIRFGCSRFVIIRSCVSVSNAYYRTVVAIVGYRCNGVVDHFILYYRCRCRL